MKVSLIKIIKISCLLLIVSINIATGQTDTLKTLLKETQEELKLITDRNVYCVNEKILFKIYNCSNKKLKQLEWSKVVYVEVITSEGKAVAQGKFMYNRNGASGELPIPSDILTGNYYIRAYTKWMRNYMVYDYSYNPITIINPHNTEVLGANTEIKNNVIKLKKEIPKKSDITLSINKSVFHKQEEVKVSAILNEKSSPSSTFVVSVVKKGIVSDNFCIINKSNAYDVIQKIYYIPETRGTTLTGRVVSKDSLSTIPYSTVHLTVFNASRKSYSTITNKEGRFFFALPDIEGNYEVFVSASSKHTDEDLTVQVDNDFCTREISLPFIPFNIKDKDSLYSELSFNSQMSNYYQERKVKENHNDLNSFLAPFYGSPAYSVNFNNFIQLPTIRDYFQELLPNVGIRKKKKQSFFRISGTYPEQKIYDPLVLVDFVTLTDVNWVLSLPTTEIEKIEIVESPFIRGNMTFGGIISIFSKNKDFAGVNLPSSGLFFKFSMLSKVRYDSYTSPSNKRLPDTRNVLYWNPSFTINQGEKANITFSTGDTTGEYLLVLKKIDNKGQLIVKYTSFIVKE